jgi:ABC-type nickel/cobalt efflux system permease component RcnA
MTDHTAVIVEKLLSIGGTAGVLYIAIWFLVKTLKEQYENRITTLEHRSDVCEEDRQHINQRIHDIQTQQITSLEQQLADAHKNHHQ